MKNAAAWIVNADGALRDAKRAPLVAGKAFFIGDGVRSMRQMNEVLPAALSLVLCCFIAVYVM